MGYWPVVKRVVKDSDIIVIVGDVRMPKFSENKTLERMINLHGKESVRVLTKIDLVSEKYLESIKNKFKNVIFVSGTQNRGIGRLKNKLMILAKRMGIKEPRIGIAGYPNMGKSAIINALAKRAKAVVSKRAGTTKGIQWIKAGSLFILDSPGVVPAEDREYKLGMLGSKNPEKLRNIERVAIEIIELFIEYDLNIFEEIYGVKIIEVENALEKIALKKGFLLKKGKADEHRAAIQVLKDWQKGKLKL
jgi:ribosome biogenesis GTPase A